MNCKNCNREVNSKFCPDCGHPTSLKRIDGHYVVHEIEHVLHFERGILFTIRELVTNPGQNIRNYLTENRSRLVKPIIFIIVTSIIYTLCNHFFHFEDGYVKYLDSKKSTTTETRIHIKGTIVSLRNILLTVCCVEIQIVTNQYVPNYLIFYLLRFS
jgi:Na+/H+-translocating membrane pyrophosphatase